MGPEFVARIAPELALKPRQTKQGYTPPMQAGMAPPEAMYDPRTGMPLPYLQQGGRREFFGTQGRPPLTEMELRGRLPVEPGTTELNIRGRLPPEGGMQTEDPQDLMRGQRFGRRGVLPLPQEPMSGPNAVIPPEPAQPGQRFGRRGTVPIPPETPAPNNYVNSQRMSLTGESIREEPTSGAIQNNIREMGRQRRNINIDSDIQTMLASMGINLPVLGGGRPTGPTSTARVAQPVGEPARNDTGMVMDFDLGVGGLRPSGEYRTTRQEADARAARARDEELKGRASRPTPPRLQY